MTHQIELDGSGRFFRITLGGEVCLGVVERIVEEMLGRRDFRPNLGTLWDLRSADVEPLASGDFRLMRISRQRAAERRGQGRVALLATDDFTFGVSRMSEVSAAVDELPIGVFREEPDAVAWVRESP
jgi:hypothetical protein